MTGSAAGLEFHPPYGDEQLDVVDSWLDDRVLVVHFKGGPRGWGYDVWVGGQDDRQRVGTTNTQGMAESWARSNFLREPCP